MSSEAFTFRPQDIVQNVPKQAMFFFYIFSFIIVFYFILFRCSFQFGFDESDYQLLLYFILTVGSRYLRQTLKRPESVYNTNTALCIMLGQSVFNTGKD